jgi:hypothetical protein
MLDSGAVLRRWLCSLGCSELQVPDLSGLAARENEYACLASHFRRHIDMDHILKMMEGHH